MSKFSFPAFRSRNYQLFFMGQGISLIGTWMTQLATVWLVYDLTQSAVWLAIASFASQIPSILLVPFSGVFVDRWNHHRTLLVTQMLSMLQSFALAALTLTGTIEVWSVLLLGLCQGFINAVDLPTRQAFVPKIVENKENLGNAIALNSSMVTSAKLVGPAIGGLLVAWLGAGYCFLLDGFSYLAVLSGLLAMRFESNPIAPGSEAHSPKQNAQINVVVVLKNLKEGLSYAFGFAPIRAVLLLVALVSFMGLSPTVVLPVFANDYLSGGAHTLGLLMASSGIGALIAALGLTQRRGIRGMGRLIAIAPVVLGIGMIGFSLSRYVWLSAVMLVVVGFGTLLQTACSNTVIQTLVDDSKRGRVMSLYVVAFMGMTSFGNLFTGSMINLIGPTLEVALSGVICIVSAICFAKHLPRLRKIVRAAHPELTSHELQPH